MFKVRSSRNERYFHICNRRACENAKILFLLQMGKNKSLPVFVQRIFTAFGCKTQTLATLQRLKLQMHLSIMPERLIVTIAVDRLCNSFFVCNASLAKINVDIKAPLEEAFQYFKLHLAHYTDMYFAKLFIPIDVKLWIFIFKHTEIRQQSVHIQITHRLDTIGKNRLQQWFCRILLKTKSLPCISFSQPFNSANNASFSVIRITIFCP